MMRGTKVVPYATARSASREIRQRIASNNHTVSIGERIGGGQQGSVFKATITFNSSVFNEISCVAKLADGKLPSPSEFQTHELITASSQLPSSKSGVLTSYGIHTTHNGKSYLLLPLCDAMFSDCLDDLQELRTTEDAEKKQLFRAIMLTLFKSMVAALTTISHNKRIHGDVKPENWGLRRDEEGQLSPCLLDFGLSKLHAEYKNFTAVSGSPLYIAPDAVAQDNHFPFETDVYAFGQILSDLLGKTELFQKSESIALIFKKGETYIAERTLHPVKSNRERKKDQAKLLSVIKSYADFDECLKFAITSMLQTLPELRPNLNTLKYTLEHLTDLLRPNKILEKRVSDFLDDIIKRNNFDQGTSDEDTSSSEVRKTESSISSQRTKNFHAANPNHLFSRQTTATTSKIKLERTHDAIRMR